MYRTYPYKLDDIRDIINELILYEDESQGGGYSPKEKEYIAKLNLKFQMINMWLNLFIFCWYDREMTVMEI